MDDLTTGAAVIVVPLLIGICEAAKRLGMPDVWAPVLACGLGLAAALGEQAQMGGDNWLGAVLKGLAMGLSSVGLYSGVKAAVNGKATKAP